MRVSLSYRSSFISAQEAESLTYTFCHTIYSIVSNPEQLLVDVDLCSERDFEQVASWNRDLPETLNDCLHVLLEQLAKSQPDKQAVFAWDGCLTYKELDEYSTKLALHLLDLSVGPESFVALCFEKSLWAVVAMFASFKIGGTCVFLEPSHPVSRLESILEDTNAKVLLSSPSTAPMFEGKVDRILQITGESILELDTDPGRQLPVVKPSSAAIALFTSGSTGKPKGIIQEHTTACTSARTCAKTFNIKDESRVMQWAAYAFDMSVIDMLMTLTTGACLCIPSEHDRTNNLAESIRSMKVNISALTPSVARTLKTEDLPSLETLVFGGEAVLRDDITFWKEKVHVINAYGPAEASVCVAGPANSESPSNIGRAVGSVTWIVDQSNHKRLVPIGVVGEILLEGPLVARGYLNDPEKTRRSFIEDPPWLTQKRGAFHGRRGRLYKSGDLGKYNCDGTIQFMGRKDAQIKLRGQRIESGDIEHHLQACLPAKFRVAADVIYPADDQNTPRLVAFVGFEAGGDLQDGHDDSLELKLLIAQDYENFIPFLKGLRKQLSGLLPSYMIPSTYLPVNRIPLTVSGKKDRKKLLLLGSQLSVSELALFASLQSRDTEKMDLLTEMEKKLARLWAEVLHLDADKIAAHNDFFQLGADSVNVIELVGAARYVGIKLTSQDVFQFATLTAMSFIAAESSQSSSTSSTPHVQTAQSPNHVHRPETASELGWTSTPSQDPGVERVVLAADMQAHMATSSLLSSHGWINYFAFDLRGPIDLYRLESSCKLLVQHHTALRTIFTVRDGRVLQIILKQYDPEFMRYKTSEGTKTLLKTLCQTEKKCEIQLRERVVRFLLVDRGIDYHTLIMRICHTQFDGTSLPLIYQDLRRGYLGSDLSEAPQFSSFAEILRSKDSLEAEAYWRTLLKDSHPTSILHHTAPPYKNIINAKVQHTILSLSLTSIQAYGLTLATLVKASWAYVLSFLSGTTDVVFGFVTTGRNISLEGGAENVVGCCNNVIPHRVKLREASTVLNLLKQIQAQQIASLPYEYLGARTLIERCTSWPRYTRYSSGVNHQNYTNASLNSFSMGPETTCDVSFQDLEFDRRDVQIYSYPPSKEDGSVKLAMAFCDHAIPKNTAQGMLDLLAKTIAQFAGNLQDELVMPKGNLEAPLRKIPMAWTNSTYDRQYPRHPPKPLSFTFSLLDPTSVVDRIWTKFLKCVEPPLGGMQVTEDTPFYELGGDWVHVAWLRQLFREEGWEVAMEDLVDAGAGGRRGWVVMLERALGR